MLTREENELLTRVGPGTAMGSLLRQYWAPALLSSELPKPDCAPVRVMLFGERLIAFRDSQSNVGLIEEACPHRGASLFFGRNHECGIRCAYHGWKFDVSGLCVGMPQEPLEKELKVKVRAKTYPCIERGGLVWAYLGPRQAPPPLPNLESNTSQCSHVEATLIDCNWVQNLEGDLDIHHVRELHRGNLNMGRRIWARENPEAKTIEQLDRTSASRIETADTECGVAFAACEETRPNGDLCWGIGQFMFPFYAMLPQGKLGSRWVVCRVPMDDMHTMTFGLFREPPAIPREQMFGSEPCHLPNDTSWFGRFRLASNPGNDFRLDRTLQGDPESPAFGSGILGQAVQDAAIAWSQGEIAPRSREHLGQSDLAVVRVRNRLLSAARALEEKGIVPPGVDQPEAYRQRHGSIVLPRDHNWTGALRS